MPGAGTESVGLRPTIPDHELVRLIGRGSYGEVWLARNIMGTYRAVKVVYRHTFESERPFEREFLGLQRYEPLSRTHEGLMQVLHVGRSADAGYFYSVMELADDAALGAEIEPEHYAPRTLRREIERCGSLGFERLLDVAAALGSAVKHLHDQGLLHRDLKPSNIIFVNGRPKIADIGLVAGLDESRSFVGTEGFIPPEGPGTLGADLYALGKVLYEAGTGKDRLSFPEIPESWLEMPQAEPLFEFLEIVFRACEGPVEKRYRSVNQLLADLALIQGGQSVRRLRVLERRLKQLSRAGLVASLLILVTLGLYVVTARQARQDRQALARVQRAEREAQVRLFEAYLQQARANRHSKLSGCRFDSLEVLTRAAAISNSPALRNEAIACLALADLRPVSSLSLPLIPEQVTSIDLALEAYATADTEGGILVRRLQDQSVIHRVPGQGCGIHELWFGSHSGRYLAARYEDGLWRLWDLAQTNSVALVSAEVRRRAISFSRDDQWVAIGTTNPAAILYHLPEGRREREIPLQETPDGLWFSPDGRQLAGAVSNALVVLDLATGHERVRLAHPYPLTTAAWRSDGRLVATACEDCGLRVWEVPEGKLVHVLAGPLNWTTELQFHPTGNLLASSAWDGTTRLWDVAEGRELVKLNNTGDDLRFSADGRRFAMVDNLKLNLGEVAGGRTWQVLPMPPPATNAAIAGYTAEHIEFGVDDRCFLTSSRVGVVLWDLERKSRLAHLPIGFCRTVLWPGQAGTWITCGEQGVQRWPLTEAWDRQRSTWVGTPQALHPPVSGFPGGAASGDGGVLAFFTEGGVSVQRRDRPPMELPFPFRPQGIAVTRDGGYLAASGSRGVPGTVQVAEVGAAVWQWTNAIVGSAELVFSPDGRWLVGNTQTEIAFWEMPAGRLVRRIPRQETGDRRGPVAFSQDGRMLAAAISRTDVQLYDGSTGRELGRLTSPVPREIVSLAFSPSGQRLVTAAGLSALELWDLSGLRRELDALGLDWGTP